MQSFPHVSREIIYKTAAWQTRVSCLASVASHLMLYCISPKWKSMANAQKPFVYSASSPSHGPHTARCPDPRWQWDLSQSRRGDSYIFVYRTRNFSCCRVPLASDDRFHAAIAPLAKCGFFRLQALGGERRNRQAPQARTLTSTRRLTVLTFH